MNKIPLVLASNTLFGGSNGTIGIIIVVLVIVIVIAVVVAVVVTQSQTATTATPPASGSDADDTDDTDGTDDTDDTDDADDTDDTDDASSTPETTWIDNPTEWVAPWGKYYTICATGKSTIGDGDADICLQVYGGNTSQYPLVYDDTKSIDASSKNGHFMFSSATGGTYESHWFAPKGTMNVDDGNASLSLQVWGGITKGNQIKLYGSSDSNLSASNGHFHVRKAGKDANGKDFYTICASDDSYCFGADNLNKATPVKLVDVPANSNNNVTGTYYIEEV